MNDVLFFLTSTYPYGTSESFIASEIPYLKKFSKVYFIPVNITSIDIRTIRNVELDNYEIIKINGNHISFGNAFVSFFKVLFNKQFYYELKKALKSSGINGIKTLIKFSIIGEDRAKQLKRILKCSNIIEDDIQNCFVYSYWMHLPIYIWLRAVGLGKKIVSRTHGFDLYEERNNGYIPYRDFILKNINNVYCISQNGYDYLMNKYPQYSSKYLLSRLGTNDCGMEKSYSDKDSFSIVSCSRVVELKRLDLIIEALSRLSNNNINWVHIGDGPLLSNIKYKASLVQNNNVKIKFLGDMSNNDILEFYKNNYFDCFINVSSTEGVPVSIMEAMSFGIPIIATDVGGTSEIVYDCENGYLLEKNCTPDDIASMIDKMINAKNDLLINDFRRKSRDIWLEMCDADQNYRSFITSLIN